jgi:putative SOS response-associated peptidase YedK
MLKWGFVPRWEHDTTKAAINARAETAAGKLFFADSLRLRRCLIPADGFYEWRKQGGGKRKQPSHIGLTDGRLFALAGVWDVWQGEGKALTTFCILTTKANELVKPIHDRMPVIVPEGHYTLWLSRAVQDPAELKPVLKSFPADAMRAFPVGFAVNDPHNDGPECVEELKA